MVLLKLQRVGKPAQRIAERTDGELDQNITIPGGIIMGKNTLAAVPYFEPEADEIALAAVDSPGLQFGLEEDVVGIEIAQTHAPGMLILRQRHAAAVIEIE